MMKSLNKIQKFLFLIWWRFDPWSAISWAENLLFTKEEQNWIHEYHQSPNPHMTRDFKNAILHPEEWRARKQNRDWDEALWKEILVHQAEGG